MTTTPATTNTCAICPGPGGLAAAGQCSTCGRPACASHLVVRAWLDHPGYSLPKSVYAIFPNAPHGVEMDLRYGETPDDRIRCLTAWANGELRCTPCRRAAADQEAEAIDAPKRTAHKAALERLEHMATAHNARTLITELATYDNEARSHTTGAHAWPPAPPQLWQQAVKLLLDQETPTHQVTRYELTGWRQRGTPRPGTPAPAWPGPSAWYVSTGWDDSGHQDIGYTVHSTITANGRTWTTRGTLIRWEDSGPHLVLHHAQHPPTFSKAPAGMVVEGGLLVTLHDGDTGAINKAVTREAAAQFTGTPTPRLNWLK